MAAPHRRRPRYPGKYPRELRHKYKELAGDPETLAKVRAHGKTPAGSHVPIMVPEILEALAPKPGAFAVDCTLGHGGHARALLDAILPGGHLLALDTDPLELRRTEDAMRCEGFPPNILSILQSNFAGLPKALRRFGRETADLVLADLGVSSMQLDTPERGFSWKFPAPPDMRMNPERGLSAAHWLEKVSREKLALAIARNSDEPCAEELADALAGKTFALTSDLAEAVRSTLRRIPEDQREVSVRRVFQAIRIEVNGEFSALDAFLRVLPSCLVSGGRAAVLTFHSGEDGRVKHAFRQGLREGIYREVSRNVVRATAGERRGNPRSASAKLRWAVKA